MFGKVGKRGLLVVAMICCTVVAQADVFNMPSGLTSLETVTIDNPGNAGELSGSGSGGYGPDRICGAVGYAYRIGKYEVTTGQYVEFLNAKAKSDPYGLHNTNMANPENYIWGCNIQRSGSEGSYRYYSANSDWSERPVNHVSYWDACRFVNWLSNGQGDGDTETGTYTLPNGYNGSDGRTIVRNPEAKWFLPTEDEWYKAAYHKNNGTGDYWDYPTSSNAMPGQDVTEATNPGSNANHGKDPYGSPVLHPCLTTIVGEFQLSPSPYGTFDQGGNVWEWNETVLSESETSSSRGARGGSFLDSIYLAADARKSGSSPNAEYTNMGFRVASAVPEPGSLAMMAGIALTALLYWGRKHV